jgi:hypothetical protein
MGNRRVGKKNLALRKSSPERESRDIWGRMGRYMLSSGSCTFNSFLT